MLHCVLLCALTLRTTDKSPASCRYEKREQYEKKMKADAAIDKELEQKWKASMQNARCKWYFGLFILVVLLWGPLFMYSSSDIFGQRKPAFVEGVHVQLEVRSLAGVCDRPDPDGCTADTYTLGSSSSAKLSGITGKADMYGPFQSLKTQADTKTNSIQKQLEETYT